MANHNRWNERRGDTEADDRRWQRRYQGEDWRVNDRERGSREGGTWEQPYAGAREQGYYGYEDNDGRLGYGSGASGWTQGDRFGWDGQRATGSGLQDAARWPSGEHRGKGPKGYTRSDERIREDVCDRLSDDDYLDASDITVTVKDGEVTLEGTVEDRRAKRRAEDLAEAVGGVRDVDNKLRKQKGMLEEMSERLSGKQNGEPGGHAGSGTRSARSSSSL